MEEEERVGREGINEGGGGDGGGSSSSEDEEAAERALLSAVRPSPSHQPHTKRSAQSTEPFRTEPNLRVCATPPPPPPLRLHHLALTAPRAAS